MYSRNKMQAAAKKSACCRKTGRRAARDTGRLTDHRKCIILQRICIPEADDKIGIKKLSLFRRTERSFLHV